MYIPSSRVQSFCGSLFPLIQGVTILLSLCHSRGEKWYIPNALMCISLLELKRFSYIHWPFVGFFCLFVLWVYLTFSPFFLILSLKYCLYSKDHNVLWLKLQLFYLVYHCLQFQLCSVMKKLKILMMSEQHVVPAFVLESHLERPSLFCGYKNSDLCFLLICSCPLNSWSFDHCLSYLEWSSSYFIWVAPHFSGLRLNAISSEKSFLAT
jgi:hypothetical protein